MDLWNTIRNLFVSKETPPPATERSQAICAFVEARSHFKHRDYQEALDSSDTAIALGHESIDIYEIRGTCLQASGFHLDALDDFDKAIFLGSKDANIYFLRAMSKSSIADFAGCVSDIQEAIRLSKQHNEKNRSLHNAAKEMGWSSATELYESHLHNQAAFLRIAESSEEFREAMKKRSSPLRRAGI